MHRAAHDNFHVHLIFATLKENSRDLPMTNTTTDPKTDVAPQLKKFKFSEVFGFESTQTVTGFEEPSDFVPEVDPTYQFDKQTTEVLLAGFENNLRVLVQGYHGTGKSTHIEQIAARLNWPCFRLNLDPCFDEPNI